LLLAKLAPCYSDLDPKSKVIRSRHASDRSILVQEQTYKHLSKLKHPQSDSICLS
jgi:hypothetical protein